MSDLAEATPALWRLATLRRLRLVVAWLACAPALVLGIRLCGSLVLWGHGVRAGWTEARGVVASLSREKTATHAVIAYDLNGQNRRRVFRVFDSFGLHTDETIELWVDGARRVRAPRFLLSDSVPRAFGAVALWHTGFPLVVSGLLVGVATWLFHTFWPPPPRTSGGLPGDATLVVGRTAHPWLTTLRAALGTAIIVAWPVAMISLFVAREPIARPPVAGLGWVATPIVILIVSRWTITSYDAAGHPRDPAAKVPRERARRAPFPAHLQGFSFALGASIACATIGRPALEALAATLVPPALVADGAALLGLVILLGGHGLWLRYLVGWPASALPREASDPPTAL